MFSERFWNQRVVPSLGPESKQMTAFVSLAQGTSIGQLEWMPLNKGFGNPRKRQHLTVMNKNGFFEWSIKSHSKNALFRFSICHTSNPVWLHNIWSTVTWALTWWACLLLLWKCYGYWVREIGACFSRTFEKEKGVKKKGYENRNCFIELRKDLNKSFQFIQIFCRYEC